MEITSLSVVALRLGDAEPETISAYVGPEPSCMCLLAVGLGVVLFGITVAERRRRLSCCTTAGFDVTMDLVLRRVPSTVVSSLVVAGKRGIVYRASLFFAACVVLYSAYVLAAGCGLGAGCRLSRMRRIYWVVSLAGRLVGLTGCFHWRPGRDPPRP